MLANQFSELIFIPEVKVCYKQAALLKLTSSPINPYITAHPYNPYILLAQLS